MPGRHAQIAHIVATSQLPPSYGGDRFLAAMNLLLMLAGFYLAGAKCVSEVYDVWRYRRVDRWNQPVTAVRATIILASLAACVRCGAEAANMLGWDPRDPATGAITANLKHYFDPIATCCLFGWLSISMVSKRAVNAQLRKDPLETKIWATLPQLTRPAIVVGLCAVMAFASVYLRGR